MYSRHYHTRVSTSFASDLATQVEVLGNRIQQMLWPPAEKHSSDGQLNSDYSLEDIAIFGSSNLQQEIVCPTAKNRMRSGPLRCIIESFCFWRRNGLD